MLKILGYADRLSAAPGETIRFMVSSYEGKPFTARIVRLIHGDQNPEGPGVIVEEIDGGTLGAYPGRPQAIHTGSWAQAPDHPALHGSESLTLACMIWPTTPTKGRQGLLGLWDEAQMKGLALEIDEQGCLAARIGDGTAVVQIGSGKKLHQRHWYLAAVSVGVATGKAVLVQRPLRRLAIEDDAAEVTAACPKPALPHAPVVMAAVHTGPRPSLHYNGKLDSPRIVAGVVPPERLESLFLRPLPKDLAEAVLAAWDFSRAMTTTRIEDTGPWAIHGHIQELPTRAMKGWNWTGEAQSWVAKPEHYGAIHFHDDDLYDAAWEEDFRWTVPHDLRSGAYCAIVKAGESEDGTLEDWIPFYVRPPRGPRGKIGRPRLAFLAPTAAYMAYANDQNHIEAPGAELVTGRVLVYQPADVFLHDHPELGRSLYDVHSDGSGVAYSSRFRPILNMRPRYASWLGAYGSGLWQFNADTHVIDWLTRHVQEPFDIITDEDLHEEGLDLLTPYACVVTGTHPEYHSTRMWDAMKAWLDRGGRLAYIAANGWYWKIAFHDALPGVIEVRRAEDGIRTWEAECGEYHHSFTGEFGGLWQRNGRPPQSLLGIGFIAQGFDVCSYYVRQPGSFDPRAAWIFEGVGADERIGDFGLVGGGAAGLELDSASAKRGTPPHALVLASSEAHSDLMLLVNEEFGVVPPNLTGSQHPEVKADIVFFETPNGGAVFSTGSIAWAGSLSWNDFDNNVARITTNVIRRFLDPKPFAG